MFTKNKLSQAVLAVLASATMSPALGQQNELEEVFVTGIRASLEASMDVKRNSAGVVDAISAEDIGKFPDTNLAESLQRITGVSIDRVNGEGSQITVRGFGPANNMVTLNGRTMPAGFTYGGGSGAGGSAGGATRAFDFANLASESVAGVQVYKTGRASISSGGIGATVNIDTNRPLQHPGSKFSIGGKLVNDTTNRVGDDITPEISALASWSNEKFGASLTYSYQERDSGVAGGHENNWNILEWDANDLSNNGYSFTRDPITNEINATIENAPENGQLFGRPNDFRWTYSDKQRERTNAQLTLQMAATDYLELTLDYTFAELSLWEHRGEWTMWLHNSTTVDAVTFDDSDVATPIYIHETTSGKDVGYEQQLREQTNTLGSLGFNALWEANDTLSFSFDVHDSSMENLPTGIGDSGELAISTGAPIATSFEYNFSGDMPIGNFTFDDSNTNNNGIFDEGDIGSAQGRVAYAAQIMDITQIKIDGVQELENGRLDFGIESIKTDMLQQASTRQVNLGTWGVNNPGEFTPGSLELFSLANQYSDYNMNGSFPSGVRAVDVIDLCQQTVALYPESATGEDWRCAIEKNFTQDNRVKEDVLGAYFQFALEAELAGRPVNILAGVRYEETTLTATSMLRRPLYNVWQDNNDFQITEYDGEDKVPVTVDNDYSNVLPSFDFDIALLDDLVGRFSFSKTIARANYSDLYAGAAGFSQTDPTYYIGAQPTARRTSPELLPLESDNLDMSLEWYYGEGSYASVGIFEKRVNNFIGTGQSLETHYGMKDASNGPRVRAAAQALEDIGIVVDATSLFVMTAMLDNPSDFPNGADDFVADSSGNLVDPDFAIVVAGDYDVHAELSGANEDPEAQWLTSFPVNDKEAKIYGSEWAVQHFFGESGFGVQANYTIVNGDVSFNDLASPSDAQFALLGLSDTANLVGIYENYGFQLRIAYNWRDSFLRETNQGGSRNPVYVDEYAQWDVNVGYDVTDSFNVFFEGLNITEENIRWFQRSDRMTRYVEDLGARYQLGARFTF